MADSSCLDCLETNCPETNFFISLIDDTGIINIQVNRQLLAESCCYFKNMLIIYREHFVNSVEIYVRNSQAVKYVINELCYPSNLLELNNLEMRMILEIYLCKIYLGLDVDISQLYKSTIKPDEFPLVLDLVDQVGYSDDNIELICRNLPMDFDLSDFPLNLLEAMLEIARQSYTLIYSGDHNINTIDVFTNKSHSTVFDNKIDNVLYLKNNQQMAIFTNHVLQIYDIESRSIVANHPICYLERYYDVHYIQQCNKLCLGIVGNTMRLYNLDNFKIQMITFSKVLFGDGFGSYYGIKSCSNEKYFIMLIYETFYIWNSTTLEYIDEISFHKGLIHVFRSMILMNDTLVIITSTIFHMVNIKDMIMKRKNGGVKSNCITSQTYSGCLHYSLLLWISPTQFIGLLETHNIAIFDFPSCTISKTINFFDEIRENQVTSRGAVHIPNTTHIIFNCNNLIKIYDYETGEVIREICDKSRTLKIFLKPNFSDDFFTKLTYAIAERKN